MSHSTGQSLSPRFAAPQPAWPPWTTSDLLRRLGRTTEAAAAYATARSLTANPVEQAFLDTQRTTLSQPDPGQE